MTYARDGMRLWILGLLLFLPACAGQQGPSSSDTPPATISATVSLSPTSGNSTQGTLTLTEEAGGVRVAGQITGLSPGEHGIHVHETGDCSAPDASSAGNHYNPATTHHGGPETTPHHVGDLGNIVADANGTAQIDKVFPALALQGARSVLGRAVVVHAEKDDLSSQPAGASGARVACGVITQK